MSWCYFCIDSVTFSSSLYENFVWLFYSWHLEQDKLNHKFTFIARGKTRMVRLKIFHFLFYSMSDICKFEVHDLCKTWSDSVQLSICLCMCVCTCNYRIGQIVPTRSPVAETIPVNSHQPALQDDHVYSTVDEVLQQTLTILGNPTYESVQKHDQKLMQEDDGA